VTPLDRLRDAVEGYLQEIGPQEGATLDGFVLLAQTSVLDGTLPPDMIPRAVGQHYATDLPAPTCLGLAVGFEELARGIVAGSMRANADDR
jgi:hypothetical protein